MTRIITDNIMAVMYLMFWIVTFIWYHIKRMSLDAGSVIIGSYVLYAVFTIFTINDDLFSMTYEPLALFPFLLLYVMLMIALSPIIYNHTHKIEEISDPNTRILKPLCWFMVLCAFALLPDIVANFGEGLVKLFTDSDAGKEAYLEQLSEGEDTGHGVSNIFAIFFNALYDLLIFFSFYYLSQKKKDKLLLTALFISVGIGLLFPVMMGQRTGVVNGIFTIIVAYFIFREVMEKKIKRGIEIVGGVFIFLTILPVVAITVSRFGQTNAGVTGYINWYVGQANVYFNNHAIDNGGIRYGDRTFNLVKQVIDPSTPKNYNERRYKYHNLDIDDFYFVTFVGDFMIDFGPVIGCLIIIIFSIYVFIRMHRAREGIVELHQMLLLYFVICVCMQGGMYLFAYSDSGNLKMFALFALYVYLRVHEALLNKFPKKTDEETVVRLDNK